MDVLEVAPPQPPQKKVADLPPDPLLVVEVTQEDIDNGVPANGSGCPIARALHRLGFIGVSVGCRSVTWFDPSHGVQMSRLPREAIRFVRAFDLGASSFLSYRPFTFALQLVIPQSEAAEPPVLDGLLKTFEGGELHQWKFKAGVVHQWNYKVHKTAPPEKTVEAVP